MRPRENLPPSWFLKAWESDSQIVTRWFIHTTTFNSNGKCCLLLQRIIGWDESDPPDWVAQPGTGRVECSFREERKADGQPREVGIAIGRSAEVRRIQPPVTHWNRGLAASDLGVRIGSAVYEIWAESVEHETVIQIWDSLSNDEKCAAVCGADSALTRGYLASTLVLIPKVAPFLLDVHTIIVPSSLSEWKGMKVASETLDGDVPLDLAMGALEEQPGRLLGPGEVLHYLKIFCVDPTFSCLHTADISSIPSHLAAYPGGWHGVSASDWRLTLFADGDCYSVAHVGVIRGLGNGYFTKEPWKGRAPQHGFSAPARVVYVGLDDVAATADAQRMINSVGRPANLCDPYAEAQYLELYLNVLSGGKILSKKGRLDSVGQEWFGRHSVSCRSYGHLHDRFIVGPRGALLIGTSLNSLGKNSSFIVALDNTMRVQAQSVFDELWKNAQLW